MSFTIKDLVDKFDKNIKFYKSSGSGYNESSTRREFIDPFLELLGWDVQNNKGNLPQYREVVTENYDKKTGRPDYSLNLNGITKFYIEAKKASIDILKNKDAAIQTRKYGWNAKHKVSILTNFEYLIIYDATVRPDAADDVVVARYQIFHYKDYATKFTDIYSLISRDAVYDGNFDSYFSSKFPGNNNLTQQVDEYFLKQINSWRLLLGNELYLKGGRYKDIDILNDTVQTFINQIVFIRICEDKNLPLYHKLETIKTNPATLQKELEKLLKNADKKYNSGLFSGKYIIFDLNSKTIRSMIEELYYPRSPFMFNIIEPNILGMIYELFLTEQLVLKSRKIVLEKKKDYIDRSVITTPIEIVKHMISVSLEDKCKNKCPSDIKKIKVADIACGSGAYLEEAFDCLQSNCIDWYVKNDPSHLERTENDGYKLPLSEKKEILTSCIYGVDIDIHAVEAAKFSLLIKLIENENSPSVTGYQPILPNLDKNILFGNSLINNIEIKGKRISKKDLIEIRPFDWETFDNGGMFDVIVGNPPYVSTEKMISLLNKKEFLLYKEIYKSSYKQFDKYYIFVERALNHIKNDGILCYIVPNKFYKIESGKELRSIISSGKYLCSIDDFGSNQLFKDRTIYSSIITLSKRAQDEFVYSYIKSADDLWANRNIESVKQNESTLDDKPWKLTTDIEYLKLINNVETVGSPLCKYANIFNGIQTSAEKPYHVYWFSSDEIISEDSTYIYIKTDKGSFKIEKSILKPYFKPTKANERGLNTYSIISSDKYIIFPYDETGKLFSETTMKSLYPNAYNYLYSYYDRLIPAKYSKKGGRDIKNATRSSWYQYGRSQGLTSFINTPKLIVGVLSKEPTYIYDDNDFLIQSGGTAGYCAISKKEDSPYSLEYIQAWLNNQYTEKYIEYFGSDFEGNFKARGTAILSKIPFVELDLSIKKQKNIYDKVNKYTKEIYKINDSLKGSLAAGTKITLERKKESLIRDINELISKVYRLDF